MLQKHLFDSQNRLLNDPCVMGILNLTPDSFSDGGLFVDKDISLKYASQMIDEGAQIIDIGGESTRPGAAEVSVDEECQRVIPVIQAIREISDIPLSIDTSKAEVMLQAVLSGVSMINDVRALRAEDALEMAAKLDVPVCLMHMQGLPRTMQQTPVYENVVQEVKDFLVERIQACINAGIKRSQIIIDPGFGFGKTLEHNLLLFKNLAVFTDLSKQMGAQLLVGISRKTMISEVLDNAPTNERLYGSVALATLASWMNVNILRVHDVKATIDALKCCQAVKDIY